MKDINLPPFYVGQRVVANKSVSNKFGSIKEEQEYVVKEMYQCSSCKRWIADVGIVSGESGFNKCTCGVRHGTVGCKVYVSVKHLSPIEEQFQSISFKEVIHQEQALIGEN